jgi:hypothetical protein
MEFAHAGTIGEDVANSYRIYWMITQGDIFYTILYSLTYFIRLGMVISLKEGASD